MLPRIIKLTVSKEDGVKHSYSNGRALCTVGVTEKGERDIKGDGLVRFLCESYQDERGKSRRVSQWKVAVADCAS
jgi:hypothetical protein